jgi:membrane-associated protease RseP (regulator of RpoE activity)
MRASDPFEDVKVDPARTAAFTVAALVSLAIGAVFYPTQAAVVAVIVAFFVMIMLHELGHFVTAKRTGMKVTEFFVGFGPRLWSVTRGETEYGIKAIPLGGYCRIIGMTNLEEVDPDDEPRAYRNKRTASKVLVAGAGPAVHFLIAVIMMFSVLFFAGNYRAEHAVLTLQETSQGAATAGLQPGDTVVAINGINVTDWTQVQQLINPSDHPAHAGDVVTFVVHRANVDLTIPVRLQESTDPGPKRVVAGVLPRAVVPHPGVVTAIAQAPRQVADFGWLSMKAIGSMFSPAGVSNYFRVLSGDTSSHTDQSKRFVSPVGIAGVATDAVRAGWVDVFGLLISINLFVGLFNLLPLLPFDGGHIAIALYEGAASRVRRRKVRVDVAKLMPLTVAVVAVLGFIFLSSLFLDITHPIANPF